jgi:sulfur carrier protein ThiS
MRIQVKLLPQNVVQEVEVAKGITVSELLQKIHPGPGPVVVLKNNAPISIDSILTEDTELSILPIISGG